MDPNLVDFYGRVARIENARALGFGFEADGTLGRSHYSRPIKRNRSLLRPVVFVLAACWILKGMILYTIGEQTYVDRVARLETGQDFDRLGAWLMQADPVTVAIAAQLARL